MMLYGVDKYRQNGRVISLVPVTLERPLNPKQERTRPKEDALIGAAGTSPRSAVDLLSDDRRIQLAAEDADARRYAGAQVKEVA